MMMASPPFLDAHMHLQDKRYMGHMDTLVHNAKKIGVQRLFCNGTDENDWQKVLSLFNNDHSIIPFIGIHPWHSNRVTKNWNKRLAQTLTDAPCGIGEIGLDKFCDIALSVQIEVFRTQLNLAFSIKRPVVIHCVKYWGVCLDILEELLTPHSPIPVMIHSFSGSIETMKRLVRLGCHLSFSAKMTEPDQEFLRSVFKQTPIHHLLLETDAPDQLYNELFSQENTQPAYNEPRLIVNLYRFAARQRKMDLDLFTWQVWDNSLPFQTALQ